MLTCASAVVRQPSPYKLHTPERGTWHGERRLAGSHEDSVPLPATRGAGNCERCAVPPDVRASVARRRGAAQRVHDKGQEANADGAVAVVVLGNFACRGVLQRP